MKIKFTAILILGLLTVACEEQPKIDIIKNADPDYLSIADVELAVSELNENLPVEDWHADLIAGLKENNVEHFLSESESPIDYCLFVGIGGSVDKISKGVSPGGEFDEVVFQNVIEWKLLPAVKEGINSKYKVRCRLTFENLRFSVCDEDFQVVVGEMPKPVDGVKGIASRIVYPEAAKQQGIQGRVFIKAFIDKEGNVIDTETVSGEDENLIMAAVKAISQTKFIPATVNGKPINIQVVIPIHFRLD